MCVLLGPLSADALCVLLVLLVMLRDVCCKRVVWVRSTEKGLDGEKDGADLEGRGPLVCEEKGFSDIPFIHTERVQGRSRKWECRSNGAVR